MNNLQIFKNEQFGEIRVSVEENNPYFCLTDLCKSLELSNPAEVKKRLNSKGISSIDTLTAGGNQKLTYVNEGNLYKVIFQSRKEEAEKFQDWVTDEVLPQIRKTGGYIPSTENDSEEDILAKAILIAQKTIENKNKVIAEKDKQLLEQKPKVEFADHVATSNNSILVREVAKIACKDGIKIGERRLYEKLREWGLVFKNSCEATQRAIERGLFEVVEGVRESSKGKFTFKTTKVTGKGQVYIINKLKAEMKGENKSE